MEITSQYLIKLGNDFFYSQSPHAAYQPVNLFTFLCKFLLAGSPLHSESTAPAFGTIVCKTQEVKGFRFCSPSFAVFFCKASELYQSALFFLQA